MVLKTIKSDKRANEFLSAVAGLFDKPSQFSDEEIHVGIRTFKCHKLILALQSTYFQELFFTGAQQPAVFQYTLNHLVPEDFQNVLHYLYAGEIELGSRTAERILDLATMVGLEDLKQICRQFIADTLDAETCVQY